MVWCVTRAFGDERSRFLAMRLGVLDVGSNTVHLLVVDAYPGARPLPAFSHKVDLSLAAHLETGNTLSKVGEERLTEVVSESLRIAEDKGVEDFLAFATSAVRDAGNSDDVLARVQERTGARIAVLTGENEARLTFLVRLVLGAAAGGRHRRRLAGDRRRAR
jgi:exopolyphosphatase / guanosine-5'-triphosphate,3'-diphosphate pyrophosphatase